MTPSPDSPPVTTTQPSSFTRKQVLQQKKKKNLDATKANVKEVPNNELGQKDRYGERITTIYPKEVAAFPVDDHGASLPPDNVPSSIATSPLLSAFGSANAASAQYTSEWTKSLPYPAKQHPIGNGINIGGPPPTPNSHPHMFKDDYNGAVPTSVSPPASIGSRPLSHPTQFSSFGGRLQPSPQPSVGRDRRSSMYARTGARSPFLAHPPLPHQPQPHFYGLQNLDMALGTQKTGNIRPGSDGYYCGFDTLRLPGESASRATKNVLLVGYEGGFDVLKVERTKMDVIGRLEGLRGAVIGAKLLSSTGPGDMYASLRPLVALTVHGPVVDLANVPEPDNDTASVTYADTRPATPKSASDIKEYQTTVEVYSLLKQEHIATLFVCPPVPISSPIDSPLFRPPLPTGDLRIDASGRFVTISSGSSGEVYVFSSQLKKAATSESSHFRCIGKLWTSVQSRSLGSASSSSSSNDARNMDGDEHRPHGVPVVSVSGRWIAVAPPASATSLSINGSAMLSVSNQSPAGLGHHTAPPQPNENCAVDAPQSDGLAGRFAREGAQAAVRGAKWAAGRGFQAYQYYFGKPGQPQDPIGAPIDHMNQQSYPQAYGHFGSSPTRHDSTMVSVYDLNRFLDNEESKRKGVLEPIASFIPPHGISHLSLSPSGVMLLTVGKKGDVQEVWNLMKITNRKNRKSNRSTLDGPHVRQVARFTRMTVANVVDVAWTSPIGRGVAILTENGTAHLYPMPSAAFQWPPARSMAAKPRNALKEEAPVLQDSGRTGAVGAMSSAFSALNGTARSFTNAYRSQKGSESTKSPGSTFALPSMTTAVGARSSKAVAKNLSKSLGTAAKSFAQAGDNRIHLGSTSSIPVSNLICWLTSRSGKPSLAIVSAGHIDIYRVFMQPARGKQHPARVKKKRMVQYQVPDVRGGPFPPSLIAKIGPHTPGDLNGTKDLPLEGIWALRTLKREHTSTKPKERTPHPLSFAELETSAPFLPFHTDRRANMFFTAEDALNPSTQPRTINDGKDGVSLTDHVPQPSFGGRLAGHRVFITHPSRHLSGEDDTDLDLHDQLDGVTAENRMVKKGGDYEEVQIIVTTRRRRRLEDGYGDQEGFFEDDCEVLDFADDRV
ncbi:hypothetical protein EJ05DRAFT_441520 [Pseudovirgaria hyperparasitica]|uniref:BCAS3 domain-containing protein n=1 Tax=Pseudovirgaria hyperparasitica TaxID=470096 RepID=A0A6A6W0Q9_9PEZI|nr:uncharacterized protein EJ05DRAFT_441520 [Pseudovirgaria hyperparasitica]KAF2756482.1 hypothetical protein EJ05DRAFT_441520 [Pseudovirgaria hyperparasitica]